MDADATLASSVAETMVLESIMWTASTVQSREKTGMSRSIIEALAIAQTPTKSSCGLFESCCAFDASCQTRALDMTWGAAELMRGGTTTYR